jgi:hypothetical protein
MSFIMREKCARVSEGGGTMQALYDSSGAVYAWLHESGKIYDLSGQNVAFVDGDSVYDWNGSHIGWWQDGHIRDHQGAAALFTADSQNVGILKPLRQLRPLQPLRQLSPMKPFKAFKPFKPFKQMAWSERIPF